MKYAIVETWNGEGYSSENLAYIEEHNSDAEAQQRLKDLMNIQSDAEIIEERIGYISYTKNDDDNGSFVFIRNAELLYGVLIYTNVNEIITILNKKQWRNNLSEAIKQCNPDELDEINLSDNNIFIGGYNSDYDYQFIKF